MTTPLRQRRAREALEAAQRATKKLPNRAARGDARGTDMTQGQQPEALVFANDRPSSIGDDLYQWAIDAETLIRAQQARIAELESELAAIGAGGVEPLRKPAAQAVQAVQVIKANCYSDDNGDYWRDCPDDCDFVDGLKVGDTYELQASIRAWSETFRVTKAPDETSDDYEVELVSTDAPLAATQPAAQAVPVLYVSKGQLDNHRDPDGDDSDGAGRYLPVRKTPMGNFTTPLYERTAPAAQGMDVVQAAKALCKHAAKIQNINFDDYWLIHAEEFKEEAQIVLDAAQAKQGGAA